ncbi:N-glycosylase/DNA lyase isoform X1 [Phyllopteryx taeniolatus]|uniref:N-glycosylase/DNA lyase isoform X1 n=1 Tax=Phyllopteryx taeniolatus TaxID=161469 RepID=UPI002AD2AC8E|nr:N-glycosylase/DNA lyase isoform X1 [Phyllopteryx taeniolatus]
MRKVMATHAVLSSGVNTWRALPCEKSELRLDLTLACGQSFRWRETGDGHWTGVMGGRVWTLTQTDDTLWYHVYKHKGRHVHGEVGAGKCGVFLNEKSKAQMKCEEAMKKEEEKEEVAVNLQHDNEDEATLRDYFQLNVNLRALYRKWGAADPHFKQIADIFTGVRLLRQDPTECLFSFICTSNNHISRIQGMVERLCQARGNLLCQLDETLYYDFPSLLALTDNNIEACLRELGFGYRARFLQQSANQILDNHCHEWLEGLRSVPYAEARDALRGLPGVGTKVADCVCLMSLDKADAVPIDTHVWQIAKRDYKYAVANEPKSLTEKLHKDIGDFFRNLWGPYAGWAQSVLFCADLKKFQKMKETPHLKRAKKESDSVSMVTCKKPNINTVKKGTVKKRKPKSASQKMGKVSVKEERVV